MQLVDDLLARIEAAATPLAERHADEIAELDERIARYGERGSGKKMLEERHKRELRRHRTDELLAGLTVIAGTYRDVDGRAARRGPDGDRRRRVSDPRCHGSVRAQSERVPAAAASAVVACPC